MVDISISQQKQSVEHLGRDIYHDTQGHNELTATIEGENVETAWVEFSLNGSEFEAIQVYGEDELEYPSRNNDSPDGVAWNDRDLREAIDIRWRDDSRNFLQLFFGEGGSAGEAMYQAASYNEPDKTDFRGATLIYEESDDGIPKVEDPNLFFDRDDETLYMFYEDGHPDQSHGWVSILGAETLKGRKWDKKQTIGGDEWELGFKFASPTAWRINGDDYVAGEEHDTEERNLLVAKGTIPDQWDIGKIAAEIDEFEDVVEHINLQGPSFYDKDGTLWAFTNVAWSDGPYESALLWTDEFDDDDIPINWTIGDRIVGIVMTGLVRYVNQFYAYGYDSGDPTSILYWVIPGSRDDRAVTDGSTVSWEWYEPTAPPESTVEWRVHVETEDGTVHQSEVESFDIDGKKVLFEPDEIVNIKRKTRSGGDW